MTLDDIELVLLREIIEKKSTCREAACKIGEWMESEEPSRGQYGLVLKKEEQSAYDRFYHPANK